MPAERFGHMILGKGHSHDKHPSLASGDIETDRNAVVVVEPFTQLAHGVGKFPAFELYLDLAHHHRACFPNRIDP
jgi:hypothetical protein